MLGIFVTTLFCEDRDSASILYCIKNKKYEERKRIVSLVVGPSVFYNSSTDVLLGIFVTPLDWVDYFK